VAVVGGVSIGLGSSHQRCGAVTANQGELPLRGLGVHRTG
jgi:hypothetical protein